MKCVECQNSKKCLDHKEQPYLVGCTSGIPARKKRTNADQIRAMSDEELEEFMQKVVFCSILAKRDESTAECRGCKMPFCCTERRYIEWLQSEVEN